METDKRMAGRPPKYTDELLERAKQYIDGGWKDEDDVVPTVVGLALYLGVSKSVCYAWSKDETKGPFLDILTQVENMQERHLVRGGLSNAFNPAITKMMLTKHGYSDKIEQDVRSSDGSMSPQSVDPALAAALAAKLTE